MADFSFAENPSSAVARKGSAAPKPMASMKRRAVNNGCDVRGMAYAFCLKNETVIMGEGPDLSKRRRTGSREFEILYDCVWAHTSRILIHILRTPTVRNRGLMNVMRQDSFLRALELEKTAPMHPHRSRSLGLGRFTLPMLLRHGLLRAHVFLVGRHDKSP